MAEKFCKQEKLIMENAVTLPYCYSDFYQGPVVLKEYQ